MQGASRSSLASLRSVVVDETSSADAVALGKASDSLFAVVSLLGAQGSLRRTLSDPAIGIDAKVQVVNSLFASRVDPLTLEALRALARLRWSEPRDVVDAVEELAVEVSLQRAEVDGALDEVEDELFRFGRIVDREPALRVTLTDRNLSPDVRRELLHRLIDGKVADVSATLIERAVVAPRGRTLERVLENYTELAAKRRQRLIAHVTSAIDLTQEQQSKLAEALKREFGHEVRLQVVVDPDLVGGMTVRVGDELIDGSVSRHLDEARRQLTGGR